MRLAVIAQTWEDVAAERSRSAKVERLAQTLAALPPDELAAGVAMLTGSPRQGRLGVGWASLRDLDVPPTERGSLSVRDVDGAFTAIAETTGRGSRRRREELLEGLFGRATRAEQGLLRGLMLQELRQGALEGVVTAAVAVAAGVDESLVRRAAMLTGDLTAAAMLAMTEGAPGLQAVGLRIGRPVQPMLASSAPDVPTALERTGPARVDTKLDGMRIQVHRDGDEVRVYTRSLRDVTAEVGPVARVVADLPARRLVLDGEALATRPDGRPLPFQDSMAGASELQPYLFDILHHDGDDLLDQPLSERLDRLAAIAGARVVAGIETADAKAATAHLRAALAAGHEGVVVKSLTSAWEAGRRGSEWVKVKVEHTLDLVVLAAEWGSGRRRGWLSNLHLGARDDSADGPAFVMLGKTFKGLTDELLAWQTEQLLAREHHRDGHVVHVHPELVVEVAFDGVQASSRYPGGVTLRFARVRRYRPDKDVGDADTITTVRAIHEGAITPTP